MHGLEFEAKHIDYRAVEEINLLVRVEYFAERTSWIIFFIHQHFSFPLLVSCLFACCHQAVRWLARQASPDVYSAAGTPSAEAVLFFATPKRVPLSAPRLPGDFFFRRSDQSAARLTAAAPRAPSYVLDQQS